jgi:hypothetical protein
MMNGCNEFNVGEPGTTYIRECLECGKSLGEQLLTVLNRECGHVTALVPQDIDFSKMPELTSDFRGYATRVGGTLVCLTKLAQEFLVADSNHICIIEDVIVRREDRGLSSLDLPILFLGSDVYYFLSSKHRNDSVKIRKTLSTLDAQRVTGVMTSWPTWRNPLTERQEITLEDVNEFADRAQMIVVDAYDGEGYLIWRRE